LYSSEEGRLAALRRFLRDGLDAGQKIAYLAGAPGAQRVIDGEGFPEALASGQLQLRDAREMYMPDGAFDPDAMIDRLASEIALAQREGYPGYRVAGDMEWALDPAVDIQALVDYERRVDVLLHQHGATALCQYDRRCFHSDVLGETCCVHPLMISDGPAEASHELLVEPGPERALVLRGQVDHLNTRSLLRSLEAAGARQDQLRLDMRELSFIDVAGLRAVGQTGERLASRGGQLTLVSPCRLVERLVPLLGIDETLTIEPAAR
jgi:anti-anti-sigma factor